MDNWSLHKKITSLALIESLTNGTGKYWTQEEIMKEFRDSPSNYLTVSIVYKKVVDGCWVYVNKIVLCEIWLNNMVNGIKLESHIGLDEYLDSISDWNDYGNKWFVCNLTTPDDIPF